MHSNDWWNIHELFKHDEKKIRKHHDQNLDDELIIIDSYDGVEHKRTTKGKLVEFHSILK